MSLSDWRTMCLTETFDFSYKNTIEFKQPCGFSEIHDCTPACTFRELMTGAAFVAFKARLLLWSLWASRHEGTITSYARPVSYLLSTEVPAAIITNTDKKIRSFKHSSLTLWVVLQASWDLILIRADVHDENMLHGFFIKSQTPACAPPCADGEWKASEQPQKTSPANHNP